VTDIDLVREPFDIVEAERERLVSANASEGAVWASVGSNSDTCPVRALRAWIEAAAIESGPLFRSVTRHGKIQGRLSGFAVAVIVKRYAGAVGLDMAVYSGHSLRAGLVTSAAIAGASERAIMNQTGHRSSMMVRRYVRDANLFRRTQRRRSGYDELKSRVEWWNSCTRRR
jgi:integrase